MLIAWMSIYNYCKVMTCGTDTDTATGADADTVADTGIYTDAHTDNALTLTLVLGLPLTPTLTLAHTVRKTHQVVSCGEHRDEQSKPSMSWHDDMP